MIYAYKRRTAMASWSETSLRLAMAATASSSIRKAASQHGIPYTTLSRHIKNDNSSKRLGRFRPVFSDEIEEEIVKYATKMDAVFYGLTKDDLKSVAFQIANRNEIPHPFRNNAAGDSWVVGFLKRHPLLSMRTPEPTSIARAAGFNRPQVERFYALLGELLSKENFKPEDIYNVDETGMQTSANRPPKVLSIKGKKQVGVISSAERGELITAVCCCSATGSFIPPALIFPRKRANERLLDKSPPGTKGFFTETGWMNRELFLQWIRFFSDKVRPTRENKVLLILDNHDSHRSLDVLEFASEHGICILSVPPHSTHKLQPLDRTVYSPFSTYFERATDTYQKNHPARRITVWEISEVFSEAYTAAATIKNAVSGFAACGIYPYNSVTFTDADFAPCTVTERQEPSPPIQVDSEVRGLVQELVSKACDEAVTVPSQTSSSIATAVSTEAILIITPEDIRPLPKASRAPKKRKTQRAEVLSSTPFRNSVIQDLELSAKKKAKTRKVSKTTKNKVPAKQQQPRSSTPASSTYGDYFCIVCSEKYVTPPTEDWIMCANCFKWSHEDCTDYDGSGDYRYYLCE